MLNANPQKVFCLPDCLDSRSERRAILLKGHLLDCGPPYLSDSPFKHPGETCEKHLLRLPAQHRSFRIILFLQTLCVGKPSPQNKTVYGWVLKANSKPSSAIKKTSEKAKDHHPPYTLAERFWNSAQQKPSCSIQALGNEKLLRRFRILPLETHIEVPTLNLGFRRGTPRVGPRLA